MRQQIMPFQFESFILRVEIEASGEPVFHAGDLCAMLGYSNPWDAVERHIDATDLVKREVTYPEATGKQRKTQLENWVREPGMWSLILGSHAPNARPIKRWVTAEVLPTIRKTGEYRGKRNTPPGGFPLTLPQRYATNREVVRLMRELKREPDPDIRQAIHAQLTYAANLLGLSTTAPVPPEATPETPATPHKRQDAQTFLAERLADGPRPVKDLMQEAEAAGYAWRTVERAKRELGIVATKQGIKAGWAWRLPFQATLKN